MKRILLLTLGAALLAGCSDRLPTGAGPERAEIAAPVTGRHAADAPSSALDGIDDAIERVLPTLDDPGAAGPLAAALTGLRGAIAVADAARAPTLLEAAFRAVDRYARAGQDAAELDTIRLALDHVAEVYAAR